MNGKTKISSSLKRAAVWGRATLALLLVWLTWAQLGSCAHAAEPANSSQPCVGIGIGGFSYWDHSHALADLQAHSEYVTFSWGMPNLDTNGWPLEDVRLLVSSDALATGTYHITLQGEVQTITPSAGVISNLLYHATANQTTADWVLTTVATGNIWIDFLNTSRVNNGALNTGFVNLHIWRPGMPTDGSVWFTPDFLAAVEKFSLFRVMDLVDANGNPALHWADRSLMSWGGEDISSTNSPWCIAYVGTNTMYNGTATNTYWPGGFVCDRGRPWELLVLLANATTNDLWLNIPVRVDDDYVTKLAQLLRYGSDGVNPYTNVQASPVYPPLNPNLKIYFEYGNEVWNSGPGFNCFGWVLDLANYAMGDPNSPICYDGVPSEYEGLYRYTAYRSSAMSLIFRQVFGDAAMMTTVRPILSSQAGNANGVLQTGLQWAEGFYRVVRTNNPVVRQVSDLWYGGGGAAYYDSSVVPFLLVTNAGVVTATTDSNLMTQYFLGLPNANFAAAMAVDATWTKAYGLKHTAYEGGPGPGGSSLGGTSGAAVSPLYDADPRMENCMLTAQNQWLANGGDVLSYYVLAGDGPWGFGDSTNTVMTTNTVKLQAIDAIRSLAPPAITLGTAVPATILLVTNPAASLIYVGGYLDPNTGWYALGSVPDPAQTGAVLIPVHTDTAALYKFQLDYESSTNATVELLLNGQSAGVWTLPAASSLTASPRIETNLIAGLTVARLRVLSGSLELNDLTVLSQYAADPPTFSPPPGTYNTSQAITLATTTAGAAIYYTTNGTVPSPTQGTLYTTPIVLGTSATLNAMAAASGFTNSPVSIASYVINNINYGALVGWDFTGAGGHAATDGNAASVATTYNDPGAQPSTLTRGPGAQADPLQWYSGLGAMNSQTLNMTTLAAAKTNGGYFQFAVAPAPGNLLSLSALKYVAYQQGAETSAVVVTEYSTNGFATPGLAIDTNNAIHDAWAGATNVLALSGIPALQNLAAPVTFRLWGYGFPVYEDEGLGQIAGDNLDVAVLGSAQPVTLSVQMSGTNLLLNWTQGILLQADSLAGPWITNSVASPFRVSPSVPQCFYRLMVP